MSETAATVGLRARWLQLSGNSRGALWMIASGLGFSVMAVGIKLLGHRLDSFQIGFFRVAIGLLAILPFVAGSDIAQLRTRHAGVHFVRAWVQSFDVILLDGYDEQGMPARLRSAAFVAACRQALRPGGMLVINLDSSDAALRALLAQLRREFDGAVLAVADDDGGNQVVFAGRRLGRRLGEIRCPAAVSRAGWGQLVDAVLRIRAQVAAATERR